MGLKEFYRIWKLCGARTPRRQTLLSLIYFTLIAGYPVVTLGFGFKSYVGFRMRLRRQKEVQKENEYYYEFLREALPPGPVRDEAFNINPQPSPKPCKYSRVLIIFKSSFEGHHHFTQNVYFLVPWQKIQN